MAHMDPLNVIIPSLDAKGAFPNTPHWLLKAIWRQMGLPFAGSLPAFLATRLFATRTNVGNTRWVHRATGVPQRGAEEPFLFLLATLPLAFYLRCPYPEMGWCHTRYGPHSWHLWTTWRW